MEYMDQELDLKHKVKLFTVQYKTKGSLHYYYFFTLCIRSIRNERINYGFILTAIISSALDSIYEIKSKVSSALTGAASEEE